MKKCFLLITVVLLLCACTPSAGTIQTAIAQTQGPITQTQMAIAQTQTFAPSLTSIDTLTPSRTATPVFTMTSFQTATPLFTLTPSQIATPLFTMTPSETATSTFTSTSTDTWTPTATINPLTLARGDGYYLVNVEIAPGTWRNNGTDEHYNWVTTTRTGAIIRDYFGPGSGTAYIGPTDFAFQATRCGTWTFLSGP
jgi:hypothetical protein